MLQTEVGLVETIGWKASSRVYLWSFVLLSPTGPSCGRRVCKEPAHSQYIRCNFSDLLCTKENLQLGLSCSRRWPHRKVSERGAEYCPVGGFAFVVNEPSFCSSGSEKVTCVTLVLSSYLLRRATRWELSSQSSTSSDSRPVSIEGSPLRRTGESMETAG